MRIPKNAVKTAERATRWHILVVSLLGVKHVSEFCYTLPRTKVEGTGRAEDPALRFASAMTGFMAGLDD